MALLLERNESRQIKELDRRIKKLVDVVRANGGQLPVREAIRQGARELGVSVSDMPYIVNSAVADDQLVSDLRNGTLAIPAE